MGSHRTLKRRKQRAKAKAEAIEKAIRLANRTPREIERDEQFAGMRDHIKRTYMPVILGHLERDAALFRRLWK